MFKLLIFVLIQTASTYSCIKSNCYFQRNNLNNPIINTSLNACYKGCYKNIACTHFSWDSINQICYLKYGYIKPSMSITIRGMYCGIAREGEATTISSFTTRTTIKSMSTTTARATTTTSPITIETTARATTTSSPITIETTAIKNTNILSKTTAIPLPNSNPHNNPAIKPYHPCFRSMLGYLQLAYGSDSKCLNGPTGNKCRNGECLDPYLPWCCQNANGCNECTSKKHQFKLFF